MLWRLEGGSRAVTAVTLASLALFGVAAFRPSETSSDVTRALSDVAWLGSQHIWPMLALGMALAGVLIIKTHGRSGSLPAWLGYFSLVVAACELGQLPIFFVKTGPFSGNGVGAWLPRHIHVGSMDSGRRLGYVSRPRTAASGVCVAARAPGCGFAGCEGIGRLTRSTRSLR